MRNLSSLNTMNIDTIRALALRGRADSLGESVRALALPGLWEVDCGTRESYLAIAADADEAMESGLDHYELDRPGRGWSARRVEQLTGHIFDGRGSVEVSRAGQTVRVTVHLPSHRSRAADGLPRIGWSYDATAIDAAVADVLGLSVADLVNPAATNLVGGGMMWSWQVSA